MLPLPAEQYPMIGEPKTLLRKRQVKQLLSTTERILEVLDEPRGRSKHVVGSENLNVSRGGISSNASCIMSCLRPLTQRTPFSSTDVVRISAKPVKFWTAVMRGLIAQNEMNESLSSDVVSVLALGDVDPLGRSGLSADAAIRRMHTNLAHASVPDMRRMLLAARAPQPILDALKRLSCAQCDAMTAPKIPRVCRCRRPWLHSGT